MGTEEEPKRKQQGGPKNPNDENNDLGNGNLQIIYDMTEEEYLKECEESDALIEYFQKNIHKLKGTTRSPEEKRKMLYEDD